MSTRGAAIDGLKAVKVAVGKRYRALEDKVGTAVFERGDFIDTSPRVPLEELGLKTEERYRYQASPWTALPRALRVRDVRPHDVFLEYGCGKGRVVYQAARRYPFRRVIGVDLSADLTAVAEENIRRNRDRLKCKDVEIVTADVMEYVPPDDVTHAYFYNPFGGHVFEHAIAELGRSVERNPRTLTIIYLFPMLAEVIERDGRFEHVRTAKGPRRTHVPSWVSVYRSRP